MSPLLLRKHSNSELISLLLLDVECTEKKQEAPMLVFGENKTQKFCQKNPENLCVLLSPKKRKNFYVLLLPKKQKTSGFYSSQKTQKTCGFYSSQKNPENFWVLFSPKTNRVKPTSFLVFWQE
jgi:hypothetical protein